MPETQDASVGPLAEIVEALLASFAGRHSAREQALALCREVIRRSANAIRAVHRDEFEDAIEILASASQKLGEASRLLQEFPEVYYAGFVADAQKEFAEASLTLALVRGDPMPAPAAIAVGDAPYLNGLGEAVGELRRYLLDVLRTGDVERCETYLRRMDEIYSALVTVDYPDALTGGLRRTTDVTRGILEKTRADLTLAAQQYSLERQLRAFGERIARP